jgi:hypothetical protein
MNKRGPGKSQGTVTVALYKGCFQEEKTKHCDHLIQKADEKNIMTKGRYINEIG